jgi:hypothetical protein
LTLTKDIPRIPFYSAIYSKPEVPKSLFSKFVKSLYSVFKSDAFNPEKVKKVPQNVERHDQDVEHHGEEHHDAPVPPIPESKKNFVKPPKVLKVKPKEDEDDDDDEDD